MAALTPYRQSSMLMAPNAFMFGPLQSDFERLFADFAGGLPAAVAAVTLAPRLDVVETDSAFEIEAEMPGLNREEIEISFDDGVLTIRGEKKVERERHDKSLHVSERRYGEFRRTLRLPTSVDPNGIKATMENGVLRIVAPKLAHAEAKKITVQGGDEQKDAAVSTDKAPA
jgi:HSP20 family protein